MAELSQASQEHTDGNGGERHAAMRPRKPLEELVDPLLQQHPARFQLAARPSCPAPSHKPLSQATLQGVLCREEVMQFLAPHELLSFWRTCKVTWEVPRRKILMLQSVFRYLRISKEAAQRVQETYGWAQFLPRMVSLCEYLAHRVYGELELDLAHRVYVAEQACFYGARRNALKMGKLASHEWDHRKALQAEDRRRITRRLGNYNHYHGVAEDEEDEEEPQLPLPVPSMQDLRGIGNRQIAWGHPEFIAAYDADVPPWLEQDRQWMQNEVKRLEAGKNQECDKGKDQEEEPAAKKPRIEIDSSEPLSNNCYLRRRVQSGFHPFIWLSFDTMNEKVETCVTVEADLEQTICNFSSQGELSDLSDRGQTATETFNMCYSPWESEDFPGGILGYIIGSPCASGSFWGRCLTLGMCIWCKRHRIPPFDDPTIEWDCLIDEMKAAETNNRYSMSGNTDFYKEALTSPEFGPADVAQYTAML